MPALIQSQGRRTWAPVAVALLLLTARATQAAVAFDRPELQAQAALQVSVPGVSPGQALPSNYAFAGRNLSPPIAWSEGPPQTRSFVVLMQDADASGSPADGEANWLVYAIPPTVLALPRGLRNVASPSNPLGASQGRNSHASLGYSGPNPAVGEPAHHYHLQVFALDRPLRLRAGLDPPPVLKAMAGHVIARGDLVITYAAPTPNAPRGHDKGAAAPPLAPSAPS